jgi:hypothetical protein
LSVFCFVVASSLCCFLSLLLLSSFVSSFALFTFQPSSHCPHSSHPFLIHVTTAQHSITNFNFHSCLRPSMPR